MQKSKTSARTKTSKTATPKRVTKVRDLEQERWYFNRELSWLEFNQRVLEEAQDATNPLLERLKFLAIVSSNLDEFFEVRVAGLQQQADTQPHRSGPDGLTAQQTLDAIAERAQRMTRDQYRCYGQEIVPGLAEAGIHLSTVSDLDERARQWTETYFHNEAFPVLTPLAIDPAHPFPQLLNKSLNLVVKLRVPYNSEEHTRAQPRDGETAASLAERFGVVQVPRVLPRLVALPAELSPDGQKIYVFQSSIVSEYIDSLFPGLQVEGCYAFRVTRNSELYLDEDEADNLLEAMQEQLQRRRRGDAVRLEVQRGADPRVVELLLKTFDLELMDLYEADGPVNLPRLMAVYSGEKRPDLKDPSFRPVVPRALRGVETAEEMFGAIRREDILLHHPYESFQPVDDFIIMAADDPNVLAIKQTLYRASAQSPIVRALMRAAENGKQVTALVELKARFDEENNIQWARQMEEAGVHVLYGLVGLKTHCKMCMVVRREGTTMRRYVHLGTGNYNEVTARLYTDVGLLTARPEIGEDAAKIFNLLTGMSRFPGLSALQMAPFGLAEKFRELVERETVHARKRKPHQKPRIIAKMNALVDPSIIQALYRASQAGVEIDLIVRGVCCLRPGIPGVSENIRVRSIVDRFLEHSRIWYFGNNGEDEVYCGSSDWMPRNFFRRIEVVFPVEDAALRARLRDEILWASLHDNVKAREIQADGTHIRIKRAPKEKPLRSQRWLLERAEETLDNTEWPPIRRATLPQPMVTATEKVNATSAQKINVQSASSSSDFQLVPRGAPQAAAPPGTGRAGTASDPILQGLSAEMRRTRTDYTTQLEPEVVEEESDGDESNQ